MEREERRREDNREGREEREEGRGEVKRTGEESEGVEWTG